MRLLIIALNLPRPAGGASTRNYAFLRALAQKHDLTLLALVDPSELTNRADVEHLEQLTRAHIFVERRPAKQNKRWQQLLHVARGQSYTIQSQYNADIQRNIDALAANQSFDAVLIESVLIAGYRLPSQLYVIIDQHNIEYEIFARTAQLEQSRLRRWYNRREGQLLKPIEIERCRQANVVLMTSDRERRIFQQLLPEQRVETVPNGVDLTHFVPGEFDEEIEGRIVFTGLMNYYPNIDGVLFFAHHCWPHIHERFPGATWQIVGREPPQEIRQLANLPGVEVTGSVPDVRPYLRQAQIAIVPLQIGSGTRLKILEGLAMRKAIVSTSIGCEGLELTADQHLVVADQPERFSAAVCSLLQDANQRHTLAQAGRVLVEQRYSWEECSANLLRVLEDLAEKEHVCS